MTPELTALAWTLVLAIVQVFLASGLRTQETGLPYGMSARDGPAPAPKPVTGRAQRAQQNLFETLPLFAAAVLIGAVSGRHGGTATVSGAWLFLLARIVYVPLYLAGIPVVRTLTYLVAVVGLLMTLVPLLLPH